MRDKYIMCIPHEGMRSFKAAIADRDMRGEYLDYIYKTATIVHREDAENDESFKQIIPYIVVGQTVGHRSPHGPRLQGILAATRLSGGNESRLHDTITLGFGGHVKWEGTVSAKDALQKAIIDEMKEELGIDLMEHDYIPPMIGLVNDDSDAVGRVHLGLLYFLDLGQLFPANTTSEVERVKSQEPDKLATFWVDPEMLPLLKPRLEGWAGLVAHLIESGVFPGRGV